MRSDARKRADAKYQAKHKKAVTTNKQKPPKDHAWRGDFIADTAPLDTPPLNKRHCSRCETAGHDVSEHLSPHSFESKELPTDGRRSFNPNDLEDIENIF